MKNQSDALRRSRRDFHSISWCLLAQISPYMKAHGLLRASRSRNPTRIRNPGCRPTCSYRLASLVLSQLAAQVRPSGCPPRLGFHNILYQVAGAAASIQGIFDIFYSLRQF